MNTNPIKTIILMFLVALLGFGCARIQRSDVKRPSRPPARTATAPVSDLLYSDGEEKIQLLSATLSKNRLPEGSSKISIRCSTSPELGVNNISLVLILGPFPSEPGLQFFLKQYYHRAFFSAALARGELDFDVPTSLFQRAAAAKVYLAQTSIPDVKLSTTPNAVPKEMESVSVSEFTSGGITRGTYGEEYKDGGKVTTHRTVYTFPHRTGAIEILDTHGAETKLNIWATSAGTVQADLPQEIRDIMERVEGRRISNIIEIDMQ